MEETKLPESMEPLNDNDLKEVGAGAETTETHTFYCKLCGGVAKSYVLPFSGLTIECTQCGKVLNSDQYRRCENTITIDGDFHTVSGKF